MKTWAKLLGAAVLLMAGGVFAMGDVYVSGTWRFKITVAVETPEGLKTGSSVYEMSNSNSSVKILDFPEAGNPATLKGEAVAVDLGKRGVLFALVPSDQLFYNAFPISGDTYKGGGTTVEGIRFYKNLKNAKTILKPEQYPQMVMFKDISDPKSVTAVDSTNLYEAFGVGVGLKNITVEITDEPVTWGIEKRLGWLSENKGGYLDGQFAGGGPELSNILHGGNFRTGVIQ